MVSSAWEVTGADQDHTTREEVTSPSLVDATDLDDWARREQARRILPQLVRRLINATNRVSSIYFPASEGIQSPGWDGQVNALDTTAFVSAGVSGWEVRAESPCKAKADSDYAKRTADPCGLDQSNSDFVFVTPRRWANGRKWAKAKQAENVWRTVRVIDADGIATWLERAPGVHHWLSELVGKSSPGAEDLETFWTEWSNATEPPATCRLITAGRGSATADVQAFLRGSPATFAVTRGPECMLELRGRRGLHGASDLRGKHAAVLSLDLCSCKKSGANLACQGCHLASGDRQDAMAHRQRS